MAADSPIPDKPAAPAKVGDGAVSHPPAGAAEVNGASVLQSGDAAARQYGKGGSLGDLPTNADLLKQIASDQKTGVSSFDRLPFNKEAEIATKMTADDLKTVGAMVDAIKNRNYDHNESKPGSMFDLVNGVEPHKLAQLKEMVNLELERNKMSAKYQVDIKQYEDPNHKPQAAFIVANSEKQTSVGFTTEGERDKKKVNELLKFLYD